MRNYLLIGSCLVFLQACAVPVPVQIASWVLDGISLAMTKKSVTDHGISVVAQKDCALWRGVTEGQVCQSYDPSVMTADAGVKEGPFLLASTSPQKTDTPVPVMVRKKAVAEKKVAPVVVAAKPVDSLSDQLVLSGNKPQEGIYFVIGSFRKTDQALHVVEQFTELQPEVLVANMSGNDVYRVVVGPIPADKLQANHRRIFQNGVRDAWAIRVVSGDWKIANLRTSDAVLAELP